MRAIFEKEGATKCRMCQHVFCECRRPLVWTTGTQTACGRPSQQPAASSRRVLFHEAERGFPWAGKGGCGGPWIGKNLPTVWNMLQRNSMPWKYNFHGVGRRPISVHSFEIPVPRRGAAGGGFPMCGWRISMAWETADAGTALPAGGVGTPAQF